MTTSGTTDFNLSIDDVVEEAFERCGMRMTSGYQLTSARRSLNLVFLGLGQQRPKPLDN
jgi:hypothetical protein